MPKKVDITPDVREVLMRCRAEGNALHLPSGQLDRALYQAVNKVLVALGGKWDRRSQAHIFAGGIAGPLAEAMEAGHAVDQKRTMEQFFTPREVAIRLADLIEIGDGTHILEPSAGAGSLVHIAMARGAHVTAVEADPDLAAALDGPDGSRPGWLRVSQDDFMEWRPEDAPESATCYFGSIDAVLMNPPFSNGQDMAHVLRALSFVRPGGDLAAIMSPHWTFASTRAATMFREAIAALDHDWTPLPEGSFRASGTDVSTGILTIRKGTI